MVSRLGGVEAAQAGTVPVPTSQTARSGRPSAPAIADQVEPELVVALALRLSGDVLPDVLSGRGCARSTTRSAASRRTTSVHTSRSAKATGRPRPAKARRGVLRPAPCGGRASVSGLALLACASDEVQSPARRRSGSGSLLPLWISSCRIVDAPCVEKQHRRSALRLGRPGRLHAQGIAVGHLVVILDARCIRRCSEPGGLR